MTDISHWNISELLRRQPFAQLNEAVAPFAGFRDWPLVEDYNRLGKGCDLRFVVQPPMGQRRKGKLRKLRKLGLIGEVDRYDGRITCQKEIPTRERNWHDFFNMAVWQLFPLAKQSLHRLAFEAAAEHAAAGKEHRSRLHDRVTIFDEGGILALVADDVFASVAPLLGQPSVPEKVFLLRDPRVRFIVFGHALYEAVLTGATKINAMTVPLPWPARPELAALGAIDAEFAARLPEVMRAKTSFGSFPLELFVDASV